MITVTKAGNLPENDVFRGRCTKCRCEIDCNRSDGKMIYDQRDGDYLEVPCPTMGCGDKIAAAQVKK